MSSPKTVLSLSQKSKLCPPQEQQEAQTDTLNEMKDDTPSQP